MTPVRYRKADAGTDCISSGIDELAREKQLRHDVVFALQTEIDELRVKKEEAELLLQSERRIVASLRKELKEVAKILNGGTL